jgi:hypothetical protein
MSPTCAIILLLAKPLRDPAQGLMGNGRDSKRSERSTRTSRSRQRKRLDASVHSPDIQTRLSLLQIYMQLATAPSSALKPSLWVNTCNLLSIQLAHSVQSQSQIAAARPFAFAGLCLLSLVLSMLRIARCPQIATAPPQCFPLRVVLECVIDRAPRDKSQLIY